MKTVINCDQVALLMDIFNRYLPRSKFPSVSQQRDMMMFGMLYETMDILNLELEDKLAVNNATPPMVRNPKITQRLNEIIDTGDR